VSAAPAAIVGRLKVSGIGEIDRRLRDLAYPEQRGVISKGLRAGAKILRAEAQSLVPVKTGLLKRSINVRAGKRNRFGAVSMRVTTGQATFVGDSWYGGAIEFGWKAGSRKKAGGVIRTKRGLRKLAIGNARRQIPGYHYMEYAFQEKSQAAVDAVAETWKQLLDQLTAGGAA
jgi:hypothetical protein